MARVKSDLRQGKRAMQIEVIKTKDRKKRRVVTAGKIIDNNFYKTCSYEHFMYKENGYGIQADVMEKLLLKSIKYIVLTLPRGKRVMIPFNVWANKGNRKDYGHGEQIFLDRKFYAPYIEERLQG